MKSVLSFVTLFLVAVGISTLAVSLAASEPCVNSVDNQTADVGTININGGVEKTEILPVNVNSGALVPELAGKLKNTGVSSYDDVKIRLVRKGSTGTPPTVHSSRVRRSDDPQDANDAAGSWNSSPTISPVTTQAGTPPQSETIGYEICFDTLNDPILSVGHDFEINISAKGTAVDWELRVQPSRLSGSYHGDVMEVAYFRDGQDGVSRSSDMLAHNTIMLDLVNADSSKNLVSISGEATIGSPATQITNVILWDAANAQAADGASASVTNGRQFTIDSFTAMAPNTQLMVILVLDAVPSSIEVDLEVSFD